MSLLRITTLALGASAGLSFGIVPGAAQDVPTCSFVCALTGQSAYASPQPAAEPEPEVEALPPSAVPKAKAKPKIVPVVIAADEPEAASTRALAAGLKGHPVRIIVATTAPAAARTADLVVGPSAGTPRAGAPLFREDLHVIGRADLATLADLQDHSVSLGAEGSAAQAIARRILAARHVAIKEVPLDLDNALDGLATGDLDAVIFFAPQPFARLKDLPGQGLHLLAAASSAADDADLAPAIIAAGAYPALASGVATPTLSVSAQLTTNARSAHPREAAAVVAALTAKARKTLAARSTNETRSVALAR